MKERISWIDYGKCVCMLMVILSHTYTYYTGRGNLFLDLMLPTRLVVFFFISGYLTKIETFDFKKMMKSIFQKLLFPYFVFTTIIWIPKHLASGSPIGLSYAFMDIFGGYASWFVAALAVSKISLALILKFTKSIKIIWIISFILFGCGLAMANMIDSRIPWSAQNGFISMFYLALGMTYRKYEKHLSKNLRLQALIAFISYAVFVCLDYFYLNQSTYIFRLKYHEVSLVGVATFIFLSILGIWLTISIVKLLPTNIRWMTYIGKNSLTYYYLNTGVLTVFCLILKQYHLSYSGNNIITVLLYIITIFTLTIASELILQYAPWMTGNFNRKKGNILSTHK